mgnify:CR=1 FL=1
MSKKVCPAQPQPLSLFSISAHIVKSIRVLFKRVQGSKVQGSGFKGFSYGGQAKVQGCVVIIISGFRCSAAGGFRCQGTVCHIET